MDADIGTDRGRLTILEWALCVLLVAIVTVTFLQVVSRYVLQTSLAWTEELARFMFIWLAALGSAYAFKTKSHFLLRFVVDRFLRQSQQMIATVVMLLVVLFLVVFVWQSVLYTQSVASQMAPGTNLSKAVPASAAVVGGVLMLYHVIRNWREEMIDLRDESPQVEGE